MPESRKRSGHPFQKQSLVPASQRTSGHLLWAVLFAVFGVLIVLFSVGSNWVALTIGAAVGAFAGWLLGKKMERDAKNK
jgi:membrane associated rhomboid family serine protease